MGVRYSGRDTIITIQAKARTRSRWIPLDGWVDEISCLDMVTWTFAVYILVERVYVTEPVAGSQLKDFGYICGLDKLLDTWHNFITLAGWRVLLCRQSFSPFPLLIYHPNFVTSTRMVELFRFVRHWVIIYCVYTAFPFKNTRNYIHSRNYIRICWI